MNTKQKHQLYIETILNKNHLIPRIKREFLSSDSPNFIKLFKDNNIPYKFGLNLLVQMALHKRANLMTLAGSLRHHCKNLQECSDLLEKAARIDLVDYNKSLRQFIARYLLSKDVQEELDKFQFPLPMIIEPMTLTNNMESGYIIGKESVILKNNHTEDDVCLDHINRMNKIAFTINHDTAAMIKNKWKNLDKCKPGESKQDFDKRKKAFQKYDNVCKDVMDLLLKEGNELYFTHKYDKRGRTYCIGYHVTYQGTEWNKAVLEFANKECISE